MTRSTTGAGPATGFGPHPSPAPPARPRRSARARAENRTGLALISPTLVIVLAVVVLPVLWTIALAFQEVRLINIRDAGFLGPYTLDNFVSVLTAPGFGRAVANTIAYSVFGTAISLALGLAAALALRKPFRGRGLVRSALLMPYVAPVVALAFVWTTLLHPQFGLVNHIGTQWLGWEQPIAFLTQASHPVSVLGWDINLPVAMITVIVFEGWRYFPFTLLFLTARVAAMPDSLEEAAKVDGATPTQRFRWIVLPQLVPTIAVLTVLRFIWSFNKFDDIYLLTGGGAGTQVVAVRIYDYMTARTDIGAASAQALVMAVVLAVLVGVYLRAARTKEVAA